VLKRRISSDDRHTVIRNTGDWQPGTAANFCLDLGRVTSEAVAVGPARSRNLIAVPRSSGPEAAGSRVLHTGGGGGVR
jgi:hypothetical protein